MQEVGISKTQIISYQYYYRHCRYGIVYNASMVKQIISFACKWKAKSILDMDLFFATGTGFVSSLHDIQLFGYSEEKTTKFAIYCNTYQGMYNGNVQSPGKYFDMMLVTKPMALEGSAVYIKETYALSRYIVFYLVSGKFYEQLKQEKFSSFGKVCWHESSQGSWLLIDKQQENAMMKIYVVTHKKTWLPEADAYVPIQAGRAIHPALGYVGDNTGENISALNPYLNECTALYWMWKHAICQYIGLVHYRRYFVKNEDKSDMQLLDEEYIKSVLQRYDIILAKEWVSTIMVKQQLQFDLGQTCYEEVEKILKYMLVVKQPAYVDTFDYVMSGCGFYSCNMFITYKKNMDQYCEWLFSFILDVLEKSDIMKRNTVSAVQLQAVGYFAERMLTVWLMKQNLRIKEMPVFKLQQ